MRLSINIGCPKNECSICVAVVEELYVPLFHSNKVALGGFN